MSGLRDSNLPLSFRKFTGLTTDQAGSKSYLHTYYLSPMASTCRFLVTALCCILYVSASAQNPGLRRPSIKYYQINTDTIRIIYPQGTEAIAQRVAHVTTLMARQSPLATGAPLRKIDILLQNATDIPNGYVGLGPWRSEFYLTPPQNSFEIGSLPWHDILAIHEFRHVQQTSSMRKGISALMYYLFGEEAFAGTKNVAVPDWFTEGDAVMSETALSAQGRGRLPAFTNAFREMVGDGSYWRYDKVRNGSFKDYIPTEYPLGYLLVNYGREKYGQSFWDSVIVEAASYKGLFYPFSNAIRRRTGLNTKTFYAAAMDHYRTGWQQIIAVPTIEAANVVTEENDSFRDFSYPVYDAGKLYVMVEQFDQIAAIYGIHDSNMTRVIVPGYQTEPVFHAGGGKLCWTELRRHPRWFREDYSVIVLYDPETHNKRTLTQQSSYFMPALSPDGKQIAAVNDNDLQQYALHILSAETGEVIATLPNPDNYFYTHPQWTNDARFIVTAARLPDGRMTLIGYDLTDGSMTEYLSPSYAPIGKPNVTDEWIYFTMTFEDVDQVFRLHRSAKYFEQVTHDGISKYQPTLDPVSGDLIYAQYSLQGKKLIRMQTDTAEMQLRRNANFRLKDPVLEPHEKNLLSITQATPFTTIRYPLLTRPIRFHSWSLYADDPEYGIEILSENTLNTLKWRSGWQYNENSGYHGPFTELSFGLWYPEIVFGYSATHIDVQRPDREFIWWQHVTNVGLRLPFYGYAGPYGQFGSFSSRFNHISTSGDVDFQLDYLSHILQFSNARKQALQHAESRFSQSITTRVLHAIDTTTAYQFHITSGFTFPSPVRNHFFGLECDYRHEPTTNSLRFGDAFRYAHGYDPVESTDIWRLGISYQFPVVYPDFGIAGLAYFRRIRLAPFFDIMRADGINYKSIGGEFLLDLNVVNVEPVTVGLRWSKRLDLDEGNEFRLILPVGF